MSALGRKVPKRTSAEPEPIVVAGHEIAVSNPTKVLFPKPKYTKLDLVGYYLAVAEGALRGAGGRPNVLVRYPNGISGEFFYQKRAPESRPPWIEVVTIRFRSGRMAEEVVPRGAGAGARRGAPGARAGDEQVVEGRAPRRVRGLQPERQRPDRGLRLLGAAHARCAGLGAAQLGRSGERRPGRFHARHYAPALRAAGRSPCGNRGRRPVARGLAGAVGTA